jgi:thioester reductase-like protein
MQCLAGEERLDALLRKPLFQGHLIDGHIPDHVRSKVVVVPGDITIADLGISDADALRLTTEVDFVIHSAASISFFEHIHILLEQNYLASTPFFQD